MRLLQKEAHQQRDRQYDARQRAQSGGYSGRGRGDRIGGGGRGFGGGRGEWAHGPGGGELRLVQPSPAC